MTFKVGDKVRVVSSTPPDSTLYKVGNVGVITEVHNSKLPYPYEVKIEGYDYAALFLREELGYMQ